MKEIELHAGHWHNTGSGANGLINEVTEARRVGKRVYEILKSSNVPVTYFEDNTSNNQSQNLSTLVNHHNKDKDGLVVSIHFNASGGTTNSAIGTEVLYYDQQQLATKLSDAIAKAGRFKNRGAKQRKNLAVLTNTYEPAVLLEICFVNSKEDVELYEKKFEEICHSIAQVLAEHIGHTATKEVKSVSKGDEEMIFSSPTLEDTYNKRISSPASRKSIVELAVKELGYSESWIEKEKNNQITDADIIAMSLELSVNCFKNHK